MKQTVTKFFLTLIPPFCSEGIVGRIWKETKRSLHHNSDNLLWQNIHTTTTSFCCNPSPRSLHHNSDNLLSYIAKYSHNNHQFLLQPKSKESPSQFRQSTVIYCKIFTQQPPVFVATQVQGVSITIPTIYCHILQNIHTTTTSFCCNPSPRSLHHNSDNLLSYIAKYSHNNNQFLLQPKSKSYNTESTLLFLCIIWVPTLEPKKLHGVLLQSNIQL